MMLDRGIFLRDPRMRPPGLEKRVDIIYLPPLSLREGVDGFIKGAEIRPVLGRAPLDKILKDRGAGFPTTKKTLKEQIILSAKNIRAFYSNDHTFMRHLDEVIKRYGDDDPYMRHYQSLLNKVIGRVDSLVESSGYSFLDRDGKDVDPNLLSIDRGTEAHKSVESFAIKLGNDCECAYTAILSLTLARVKLMLGNKSCSIGPIPQSTIDRDIREISYFSDVIYPKKPEEKKGIKTIYLV